jgi:hypothetical protein
MATSPAEQRGQELQLAGREQRGQDRGRHDHGAADRQREAQAAPAARDGQGVLERAEDGVVARHGQILQRVVDRRGRQSWLTMFRRSWAAGRKPTGKDQRDPRKHKFRVSGVRVHPPASEKPCTAGLCRSRIFDWMRTLSQFCPKQHPNFGLRPRRDEGLIGTCVPPVRAPWRRLVREVPAARRTSRAQADRAGVDVAGADRRPATTRSAPPRRG